MSEINLEKNEENTEKPTKKASGVSIVLNINLLGCQVREELEKTASGLKIGKSVLISIALIALAIVINLVSYLVLVSLRDEQVALKQKLEARKAELEAKSKELVQLNSERDILKQKKAILAWATGSGLKWSSLLEEIRDRTPSNLWVNKIDINESLQVTISGKTFDHKTVSMFLANLQDSPMLSGVVLDSSKKVAKIKIRDVEIDNSVPKPSLESKDKSEIKDKFTKDDRLISSETAFNIRATVVPPNQ